MTSFKADLHTHTYHSDGSYTMQEVIDRALGQQMSALSITDHDSVDAYFTKYDSKGLIILPGVEFSSMLFEEPVHILGYGFSLEHPSLKQFCDFHKTRRIDRFHKMLKKTQKLGMGLDLEQIKQMFPFLTEREGVWGRPHLAHAMVNKGIVPTIKEAFYRYLSRGKPCYEPSHLPSVEETIRVIKEARGLAVLAHPHLIRKKRILDLLLQLPFDGLEGYYALFPLATQMRFVNMALAKQWLVTGGSDFHGLAKPDIEIGSSTINQDLFTPLWDHYQGHLCC